MKIFFVGLLAFLVPTMQAQGAADAVRQEAGRCASALVAGDFAGVVARTHPRIVAAMGGPKTAAAAIEHSVVAMRSSGFVLESAVVGPPARFERVGEMVVALVPQRIVMRVGDRRLQQDSYLLAMTSDAQKWYFVDLSNGPRVFQRVFPELAGQVSLPAPSAPVDLE